MFRLHPVEAWTSALSDALALPVTENDAEVSPPNNEKLACRDGVIPKLSEPDSEAEPPPEHVTAFPRARVKEVPADAALPVLTSRRLA